MHQDHGTMLCCCHLVLQSPQQCCESSDALTHKYVSEYKAAFSCKHESISKPQYQPSAVSAVRVWRHTLGNQLIRATQYLHYHQRTGVISLDLAQKKPCSNVSFEVDARPLQACTVFCFAAEFNIATSALQASSNSIYNSISGWH